jgi:hypothetical protein
MSKSNLKHNLSCAPGWNPSVLGYCSSSTLEKHRSRWNPKKVKGSSKKKSISLKKESPATKEKKKAPTWAQGMKGWKYDAPKKGKEREQLLSQCGSTCFLLPGQQKFPICQACRTSMKCDCNIDKRGVKAAIVRAGQYKYTEVAKKARKILDQM